MSDVKEQGAGPLFWILGVLFLLWNAAGCYAYWLDVSLSDAKYAEIYGEAMAAIRGDYSSFMIAAYAIAVWGGLLAAILYLLRKKWAVYLFIVSFITAMISNSWVFTNADAKVAAGSSYWVMPAVIFVLGVIEILWSRKKATDGTLV